MTHFVMAISKCAKKLQLPEPYLVDIFSLIMIYLTNHLTRSWYNSMFEHKYTQYTMPFYAFLILQAYKTLKGQAFWSLLRLKCSSMYGLIDVYPKIYHGKVLFLIFN